MSNAKDKLIEARRRISETEQRVTQLRETMAETALLIETATATLDHLRAISISKPVLRD
jgi:hypothetical protein